MYPIALQTLPHFLYCNSPTFVRQSSPILLGTERDEIVTKKQVPAPITGCWAVPCRVREALVMPREGSSWSVICLAESTAKK